MYGGCDKNRGRPKGNVERERKGKGEKGRERTHERAHERFWTKDSNF